MRPQTEVTGYMIREAITRWKLRKQIAEKQFRDSLYKFKDEEKTNPSELAEAFAQADRNIALLEDLRQRFNLEQKVKVGDKTMSLSVAVKMFGGTGRLEKLWRDACSEKEDRYNRYDRPTRRADEEVAQKTMGMKELMAKADDAAKAASQLRSAISMANAKTIIVPTEYPADLFEGVG